MILLKAPRQVVYLIAHKHRKKKKKKKKNTHARLYTHNHFVFFFKTFKAQICIVCCVPLCFAVLGCVVLVYYVAI